MVQHPCPKGCGHFFDNMSNVNAHLAQKIPCDSPARKYPCPNENCCWKFTSRQSKFNHLKTCTNGKETKETLKQANSNMKETISNMSQEIQALKEQPNNQQQQQPEMQSMIINLLKELGNLSTGFSNHAASFKSPSPIPLKEKEQQSGIVSATDIIDRRSNQFYFCDPPGEFFNLKIVGDKSNNIITFEEPFWVIKIGYNGEKTGRQIGHDKEYGGISRVIDSLMTPVAAAAELKIKDLLMNEGKLYSGLHSNKKSRDTELIIVRSQKDYTEYVEMARTVVRNLEDGIRNDMEGLKRLKGNMEIMDSMCKQMEAMVESTKNQAIEIEEKIKQPVSV